MTEPRGLGKEDIQPILDELKRGLEEIYGPRLRQVILFGSFARGEAEPDSDIDVAVVLEDYDSAFEEIIRIDEVAGPLSLLNDTVIAPLHVREEQFADPAEVLHSVIRREGLPA